MSLVNTITSTFVPIHREGWRFVAILAAVTLILFWFGLDFLALLALVVTAWCAYFFRDPERVTPLRAGLVISPADGRVSAIERVVPPPELELAREPVTRISVFMNVFDVHVNRSPVDARIAHIAYVPGTFLSADLDKASDDNERQAFTLELADGRKLGVVQIAGLVARRIIRFVERWRLGAGRPAHRPHSLRQPRRCLFAGGRLCPRECRPTRHRRRNGARRSRSSDEQGRAGRRS